MTDTLKSIIDQINPSDQKEATTALSLINQVIQDLLKRAEEISEQHELRFSSDYTSYIENQGSYKKTDKYYGDQDWVTSSMYCAEDGDTDSWSSSDDEE